MTGKRSALPKVDYKERVGEGRQAEIAAFAEREGLSIKDYELFNRALSHKSFTNEQNMSHNEQYEKLEFFGDGVLGLIINEYLFKSFPDYEEGDLSKIKSAVVSEVSLAEVARKIELSSLILIGRGESHGGGTERPSLLADVLEAVIGSIYLDQGLPTARKFVLRYLESSVLALSAQESTGDYKSYFQEVIQKECGVRPSYSVMKSSGPDHSRLFKIAVSIAGKRWGIGTGKSKKEAEQVAAEDACKAWDEAKKNPKPVSVASSRRGGRGRGRGRGRGDASTPQDVVDQAASGQTVGDQTVGGGATSGRVAHNKPSRRGGRRGAGKPRPENVPQAPNHKESGRGGRNRRGFSGRSRNQDEDIRPPAAIEDPLAWATGETYVRRPRPGRT